MRVAWANFVDWHAESRSFEALSAFNGYPTTVLGAAQPLTANVSFMSEDFWRVFRVQPAQGRLTLPADHLEGAAPVAVVSDHFWRTTLSGAPLENLVLEVQGEHHPVVGVASEGFHFPGQADIWIPVSPETPSTSRSSHNWQVVGRLRQGMTLEGATAEMEALTLRLVQDSEDDPDYLAAGVVSATLQERMVGGSRRALYLLLGAAGLVLLVACTNLASTLLARGANRARELAVRASLGAARSRIVRQLLTENVILAVLGAGLGSWPAGWSGSSRAWGPRRSLDWIRSRWMDRCCSSRRRWRWPRSSSSGSFPPAGLHGPSSPEPCARATGAPQAAEAP